MTTWAGTLKGLACAAGLTLLAVGQSAMADEAEGVVRVRKPASSAVQPASFADAVEETVEVARDRMEQGTRRVDARLASMHGEPVPSSGEYVVYEDGYNCRPEFGNGGFRAHCADKCYNFKQYIRCKFGYFYPTGNGGTGIPIAGHYSRVYPENVNYFDGRDGQVYGAEGYGTPIGVPLAPVVGHTYNYGWGVPSSRLTPVSRPTAPTSGPYGYDVPYRY
jgi:hypothetical protein